MNKINSLDDLKNFTNSEVPTIKFSEVCQLIKKMEDNVANIKSVVKPGDHYDQGLLTGYGSALNDVKRFFLGDWKIDTETGDIVTTFMGKEISRTEPPKIKFINGSEINVIKSCGVKNLDNVVIQHAEYLN